MSTAGSTPCGQESSSIRRTDELGELLDGHLVVADQTEGVRRGGGLEDLVLLVDDQRAGAQDGQDGGDAGGQDGLLDRGRLVHLRLAHPPRKDDACAEHCAEQREEERLGRTVHGSIVRPVSSGVRLVQGR